MAELNIPVEEFIKEHKKLVQFLKHPTDKVRREEYLDQSRELREVEDRLNRTTTAILNLARRLH